MGNVGEKERGIMFTKELQEAIIANMKRWQEIEDQSMASTSRIAEETENPIVQIIMDVIKRDSHMHHRVQGLIAESLGAKTITLTPEDLETVWEKIEAHIELEKETVRIAGESLAALQGKKMVVQEYLLNYLLTDENKHNQILNTLETIKKGMYPYG
jgi:hypothetical protein